MLQIQLFGHFQATRDGEELPGLLLNGAYRLLAYLALQAGKSTARTLVAEALWPATGSLDSLSKAQQLRRALGPEGSRERLPAS